MKVFLIKGDYVPASAIAKFKPVGHKSKDGYSDWEITLFNNSYITLPTSDMVVNAVNRKAINEICEYFEIEFRYSLKKE